VVRMWVYGEPLLNVLLQKGFIRENPRDVRFFTPVNSLSKAGGEETTGRSYSMILNKDEFQYGPYTALAPGTYELVVQGSNLDKANYEICRVMDDALHVFQITEFEEFKSGQVVYRFTLPVRQEQIEFYTINKSDEPVRLEFLFLRNYTAAELEPLSVESARKVTNGYMNYSLRNNGDFYKMGNLRLSGNAIKGQTGVLLRQNGGLEVGQIALNPGRHKINIRGKDVSSLIANVDFPVPVQIISQIPSPDGKSLTLIVDVEDYVRGGKLSLLNPTGTDVYFDGFGIFYVSTAVLEGEKNVVNWSVTQGISVPVTEEM